MKTKSQSIAGQISFGKSELLDRMEGLALSWLGQKATFKIGKRELEGEVIDAKFKGIWDNHGQFDLTVKGKSGRIKTIDYWENEVQIEEKQDERKKRAKKAGNRAKG